MFFRRKKKYENSVIDGPVGDRTREFLRGLEGIELGFNESDPIVVYQVGDDSYHHTLGIISRLYDDGFELRYAYIAPPRGKRIQGGGWNKTTYEGRHAVFVDAVYNHERRNAIEESFKQIITRNNGKYHMLGVTYIGDSPEGPGVDIYKPAEFADRITASISQLATDLNKIGPASEQTD